MTSCTCCCVSLLKKGRQNRPAIIRKMTAPRPTTLAPLYLDCGDCPIRKQAICARCQPDELAELNAIKSYHTYKKGEMIAYAGGEMRHVGTLVTGLASISQGLEDGRRQIMGILLPSDFVGAPKRKISQYDIQASAEVIMCQFERGAFEVLFERSPDLGPRLLEMTMDELDAAWQWMLLLGRKSAREQIATFLCMIASKSKFLKPLTGNKALVFDLPLSREMLADYLGLTIETVSRQISTLKNEGLILVQGQRHIIIPDFSRLLRETGGDYLPAAPD